MVLLLYLLTYLRWPLPPVYSPPRWPVRWHYNSDKRTDKTWFFLKHFGFFTFYIFKRLFFVFRKSKTGLFLFFLYLYLWYHFFVLALFVNLSLCNKTRQLCVRGQQDEWVGPDTVGWRLQQSCCQEGQFYPGLARPPPAGRISYLALSLNTYPHNCECECHISTHNWMCVWFILWFLLQKEFPLRDNSFYLHTNLSYSSNPILNLFIFNPYLAG